MIDEIVGYGGTDAMESHKVSLSMSEIREREKNEKCSSYGEFHHCDKKNRAGGEGKEGMFLEGWGAQSIEGSLRNTRSTKAPSRENMVGEKLYFLWVVMRFCGHCQIREKNYHG